MHPTAIENMQKCFERYICRRRWNGRNELQVIDIGGADIYGSYADIFSSAPFRYRAVDVSDNENVDVVLEDPYRFPFEDDSIDIVISGQAFEHIEFFWLTFEEMTRVLKQDGMRVLIAPSAGPVHRFPVDCYRFHPDGYRALAKYAGCRLLEVWEDRRGPWRDVVGVFTKAGLGADDFVAGADAELRREPSRYESSFSAPPPREPHADPEVERSKGRLGEVQVLRRLHDALEPRAYLEIGVKNGDTLALAACPATGIGPSPVPNRPLAPGHSIFEMSSDEFFDRRAAQALAGQDLDLVLIDGMPLFEFALRDFMHAERLANRRTVVAITRIYPNHPRQASRIRETGLWAGDVWKLHQCLRSHRPDLALTALDVSPAGMLLVSKLDADNTVLWDGYNPLVRKYRDRELSASESAVLERELARDPRDPSVWDDLRREDGPGTRS
jgi:SAM-dependent methyltransferase